MAGDDDRFRHSPTDPDTDDLEALKTRHARTRSPGGDTDPVDPAEDFTLPDAEISDEELTVAVIPMLADEFRCRRCFLVHHRSQLADPRYGGDICQECVQ